MNATFIQALDKVADTHVQYKVLAMSLFTYRFASASLLANSSVAV
jgi:hypothetical protein